MILVMKKVSIQDLKAGLSAAVAEAEAGRTLVITRHNEPVAQLGPARAAQVHRGARVGLGRVKPALERATKGRYLAALLEDRGSR
jgi:prevent-host-death family protein